MQTKNAFIVSLKINQTVGCDVRQVIDLFTRNSEDIEANPNAHMWVMKIHLIVNLMLILASDIARNDSDYDYKKWEKIKNHRKKITREFVAEAVQSHWTLRNY